MLLLPLLISGFLVSLFSVCRATLPAHLGRQRGRVVWHKTERFRKEGDASHGYTNGNGTGAAAGADGIGQT